MATLQAAIDQLVTAVKTLSGIRLAPDEPLGSVSVYPSIMTFVESGTYSHTPIGVMTGLHTVIMDLIVADKDLTRDTVTLMGYAKSIPNAIYLAHKDGSLTALDTLGSITYEFGPITWGGQECLGFRFRIRDVKTQDTIV